MDIDVFTPDELPTALRVLRTALRPDGSALDAREQLFLATYARITGAGPALADDPPPIASDEVAPRIPGAHAQKRLLQLAALAALLARPLRPAALDWLRELSRALATSDPVLAVLDDVAQGRPLRARVLTMRRGLRVMCKEAFVAEGPLGVLRLFAAMWLRIAVNQDRHARYRRLGLLPEGTLGREYWKHMTEVGFGFPGEHAGIPDSLAYHDIVHVLAQHETTPLGEIQQGSFQAGNRREDGFFFVQFVVLQFHHGIRITPATGPTVDCFEPDKLLWAIHRGARCSVDMTHQWDFWPLMALPLAEARRRCALLPHLAAAGIGPASVNGR